MKEPRNIVWLKRDLRLNDHLPLLHAENAPEDYLIIYIFEPSALSYADSADRHQQFVYQSILEINNKLNSFNRKVELFHAEALEVFTYLIETYNVKKVFSYRESGIQMTFDRDIAVGQLLSKNNIQWTEFQRDGIQRGIKNRKRWDALWYEHVNEEIQEITITSPHTQTQTHTHPHPVFPLSPELQSMLSNYSPSLQKPGENMAWKYLQSFCEERGKNYNRHISKPTESRKSCGRISPYLAWGNISIRQCVQYIINHPNYKSNKRAFDGLITRLKWHCHFIQKFEVECAYETRCVNRGYEALEHENNPEFIQAWKDGKTGFPLVDACMRCLHETGWINFRMRAMIVSVLCHHFDCDWRSGVYHLAQLFLDYEPGIHYTQFQMQAGTTGVNTIRMYNPVKQSQDHDPEGIFIKKWVPELRDVPKEFIHEPWKMTEMDKMLLGIELNYPHPLVDLEQAGKAARIKIWGHRKNLEVKEEGRRIVSTHTRNTSRKRKSNAKK